jgi:hypothetical protein
MKHLLGFNFIPGPILVSARVAQYEALPFRGVAGFAYCIQDSNRRVRLLGDVPEFLEEWMRQILLAANRIFIHYIGIA